MLEPFEKALERRGIVPKKRKETMHYKNGREAKNGDKVVLIPSYGKLAPTSPSDPSPNLKECLHLEDVLSALAAVPEPPKA